jgi:hypothetical protein
MQKVLFPVPKSVYNFQQIEVCAHLTDWGRRVVRPFLPGSPVFASDLQAISQTLAERSRI